MSSAHSPIVNSQSPIKITLVAASARNGVIGRGNTLPWRMSDDLKRFKALTTNHAVIMGRRTFESMNRKPLPERTNIVITRDTSLASPDVQVAHDFNEALRLAVLADEHTHHAGEVFVIGGTRVFESALPVADRIHLTQIEADIEGDAYFPNLDSARWRIVREQRFTADERNEYPCTLRTLERAS